MKVLEKLPQRPYFQSCDRNTAISLADTCEIATLMDLPVPN